MSIIYITKDAERTAGIDLNSYRETYVLTNRSPLADALYQQYPDRILLNDGKPLSTLELCKQYAQTISRIDQHARILVFKTSKQIERVCQQHNWQLLNPSAELTEKFERKISQADWFTNMSLDVAFPETVIAPLETLRHDDLVARFGNPYILQFNLGHTGEGTKVITSPYDIEQEIIKSPQREVKISKFLHGHTYTINACVCPNDIHVGQIALQLTNEKAWSDNPFATVGNDWNAAKVLYPNNKTQITHSSDDFIPEISPAQNKKNNSLAEQIIAVTQSLGRAMRLERWQGLFGVDFLIEENTQKLYLLEVNARQQSGASFETQLAHLQGAAGPLDWHLHCLSHVPTAYPNKFHDIQGSQVFLRKNNGPAYERLKNINTIGGYSSTMEQTTDGPLFDLPEESKDVFIIPYAATDELYRVQSYQEYDQVKNTLGI